MRTRHGLPFVCTNYMKTLLRSVAARVQRDHKVTLCHLLWMGNHPHIIVIAKDKKACTSFYGELQKQLTESVKRLCGFPYLSLWKNNATSVIPYHDVETVCYRIGYLYANPARANLVDTVADYPGFSSWKEFLSDLSSLNAVYELECPWVQQPFIEKLSGLAVSRAEDLRMCQEWKERASEVNFLRIQPNAWMKCFGVSEAQEVESINNKIIQYHTGLEQEAREKRQRKVMGRKALIAQPLNLTYRSKKPSRRIFVYSLDPEFRKYLIKKYREFCDACTRCYERWKLGDLSVKWPDGALLPPVPHIVNDLCSGIESVY